MPLATRNDARDLDQLRSEADAVAPGCAAVNLVAGELVAGYWPAALAPEPSVWEQVVANHVPDPEPEPAPSAEERIAALEETVNALLDALGGGDQ